MRDFAAALQTGEPTYSREPSKYYCSASDCGAISRTEQDHRTERHCRDKANPSRPKQEPVIVPHRGCVARSGNATKRHAGGSIGGTELTGQCVVDCDEPMEEGTSATPP